MGNISYLFIWTDPAICIAHHKTTIPLRTDDHILFVHTNISRIMCVCVCSNFVQWRAIFEFIYIQNTQQLCHVRACLSFVTIIRSCDVALRSTPFWQRLFSTQFIYETKICFYVVKCVNNAQGINRLDNDYVLNIVHGIHVLLL